jgi:hypothetical protein
MKRSALDKKSSSQLSTVVLEIGCTLVRGGIAGECAPRFIISTPFLNVYNSERETLSTVALKMNCLEGIRSIFLEYLQIRSKDCNVLIIENMFAPKMFRDQLFNVLLNEMQVQSVCFQPDMLMPILATGTAMILQLYYKSSHNLTYYLLLCMYYRLPVRTCD